MVKKMVEKIEHFRKVTLSLEAGAAKASMDLTPKPLHFEFIYGLGTEGLTPFEKELAHRGEGEVLILSIKREDFNETFKHLALPAMKIPEHLNLFYLKIRVDRVIPADQREVIGAMAEIVKCGDHCCGH